MSDHGTIQTGDKTCLKVLRHDVHGEISLTDYSICLESRFQTEYRLIEPQNEYSKSLVVLYDNELVGNLAVK